MESSSLERLLGDPDRLEALKQLDLLDERNNPQFDHLASVARQALGVPIALITLVDLNRQVFVSCPGLAEPWASRGETPLTHSFCKHVVASGEPLVIEDAREHSLVLDNLAIRDLRVIAYAGIPLTTQGGHTIGTLCAIDTEPRRWAESEIVLLRRLATCVLDRIRLRAWARRRAARGRFLSVAIDALPGPLVVCDRRGGLVRWNRPLERLTGYRDEDLAAMTLPDLVEAEERSAAEDLVAAVFEGGSAEGRAHLHAKDGYPVPVRFSAMRFQDAGASYFVALGIDLTEQERAEAELAERESRYRSLVRHAAYGIYRTDPEGRVLAGNPAFVRLLGYGSEDEILGLDLAASVYVRPEERARLLQGFAREGQVRDVEVEWRRADGSRLDVRLSGRRIQGPNGEWVAHECFVEDVTERRRLEEALHQRQKMEAIGRLSGGVAHDFNNLLTVMQAEAQLAASSVDPDSAAGSALGEIRKVTQRCTELVRQLLTFARRQPVTREAFDLNGLVSEVETMLERLTGSGVELEIRGTDEAVVVDADRGQVEQVLLNLVVNAVDAMRDGGRLRVEVGTEEVRAGGRHHTGGARPGTFAVLAVRDTGVGMPEEVRERAFEPFFTTKPPGEGTGLGLATAWGIVRRSGGSIEIDSTPGAGTTIRVYLPLAGERDGNEEGEGEAP